MGSQHLNAPVQVMGIMALLAEIYALDRLKLNLKFEIEMVFRNLGLQVCSTWQLQKHTASAANGRQAARCGRVPGSTPASLLNSLLQW
jgi:CCR4-NOT transcription complex subunit 1 CAF1-binding domain